MKEKRLKIIIIIAFDLFSLFTFLIISSMLDNFIIGLSFFALFAFTNMLIPEEKRVHACFGILTCYITSTIFLTICLLIYIYNSTYMSGIEAYICSALLVIIGALTTTNYLWWGGNSLNNEVFEWVKFNQNNIKLKEYEEKLKEKDMKLYYIFQYRFRKFMKYKEIRKLMNIDEQRISEEIKLISHYIEYEIKLG